MAGIFPNSSDGGQPPNSENNGQVPTLPPQGTQALYYSSKCGSKMRPETINAILSEIACAVDELQRAYDSGTLCNLSLALQSTLLSVFSNRVGVQGPPGVVGPVGICPICPP